MDYLQLDNRSPLNMRRRAGQVTQPVVHELGLRTTPLLIGQKDTTAIGKDRRAATSNETWRRNRLRRLHLYGCPRLARPLRGDHEVAALVIGIAHSWCDQLANLPESIDDRRAGRIGHEIREHLQVTHAIGVIGKT